MMIEGAADFVTEEQMMGAIDAGMKAVTKICKVLYLIVTSPMGESCLPFMSLWFEFVTEEQIMGAIDTSMKAVTKVSKIFNAITRHV